MNRLGKLFVAVAIACAPAACKKDAGDRAENAAENLQEQREDVVEESRELNEAVQDQAEDQREMAQEATEDRVEDQREVAEPGEVVDDDRVAGLPENASGRLDRAEGDHNANQVADESEDVAEQAKELQSASAEFEARRTERLTSLRAVHSVISAQPNLITTFAGMAPLTVEARNELNEKMQVFQMRLDEAGNAIESLQSADANTFEDRDDTVENAMDRLEEARDDAWEALDDGDRIEPAA